DNIFLLEQIFHKEINKTNIKPYQETLPFFLGIMALESENIYKKYWGYHKIMEFYKNDANAKILYEKYNFTFKDYLQLAKKCDTGIFYKKYRKYKKISNFLIIVCFFLILCIIIITIY
ncbi:glycosyltransferase family 2 protein, partial [Campylobacter jejuni]|nr:glycosyltransferase family 2 protein [Campylobacter jejuni]